MMNRLLHFTICFFCFSSLHAQLSFSDRTDLIVTRDFFSGVAIGIADMNGDGLDDIVRMDQGKILQVEYQTNDCSQFRESAGKFQVLVNSAWNIMLGDVNNDGFCDVMAGGASEGIMRLLSVPYTDSFTMAELPDSRFFAQAANFVDINRDGLLDAFICDDNAESKIFMNQGDGDFVPSDLIDFSTDPPTDKSGNYGSVWTDFDSDGDLDLYIAKCRQGVDDPSDPRRINMLFVNEGDTSFVDRATQFGLADNGQSWTGDFGDLDGDGDLDCFVTNHDRPSVVYENLGDTLFVDITDSTGVTPSGILVQGVLQDLDNDGLLDIITSGTIHDVFLNEGNMQFSRLEGVFGDDQVESFSIGDLNNDGFLDVYAGYAELYTTPSNRHDKLWLNDGNGNHFIRFQLRGNPSNAEGVGARVEIFGEWGKQVRDVRAGESYGITLSKIVHFGLGNATVVDSAVINWPSGQRDVLVALDADQFWIVREGGCAYQPLSLGESCMEICQGDSVTIGAPPEFVSYAWSNGDTNRVITVRTPGLYFVRMETVGGCQVTSLPVHIRKGELPADLPLSEEGLVRACAGTAIDLAAPEVPRYAWNTGDSTRSITVTESGAYFATLITSCEVVNSDTVYFEFTDPGLPVVQHDTLSDPGSGVLISNDPTTYWYLSLSDQDPVAFGDTFITPIVDTSTLFFAALKDTISFGTDNVGQPQHTGFTFYNSAQFNGGIIFDVESAIVLESVDVYTGFPGARIIEIHDSEGQVIFATDTLHIEEFRTTVDLNAMLEGGNDYVMTTRESLNNAEFGMNNPRLYRSDNQVSYPYQVPDLINLKTSIFGEDFFYYFYNWKVRRADLECEGERVPVTVFIDEAVNTQRNPEPFPCRIFPNPANDQVTIEFRELQGFGTLTLHSISGKLWHEARVQLDSQYSLDVGQLMAGSYILLLNTGEEAYRMILFVQHH